jgi:ABC-2 type transport system permease protein
VVGGQAQDRPSGRLIVERKEDGPLEMFFRYSLCTVKAWFQYRVDAFSRSLAVFLRESTTVIVISLTLRSFDSINGWNANEMLFLFSLVFLTYGIFIVFFTGLRDFEWTVRGGGFDRLMLRPRGLLFQVIASNADWFAAIGQGGLGIVLFIISAGRVHVRWNAVTIPYYAASVVGGVLIQGAVFLFFAALCFHLAKTSNIRSLFYWNARKFSGYPVSIFPKVIQFFMIYVMPFAFVNFFPAQFLLRKPDMAQYPAIYLYLAPFIGIAMYALSYAFWRYSLKRYKSTGN